MHGDGISNKNCGSWNCRCCDKSNFIKGGSGRIRNAYNLVGNNCCFDDDYTSINYSYFRAQAGIKLMTFIKIIAITIITAILALIIKQVKPEYAIFVQLGGITIIAMFSISYFSELSQTAYSIIDVSGININFFKLLIKALIISVTAEIAADICRDSDSKALAGNIELAAKIVIISMSVPIIKEVAEIAVGLING